MNDVALCARWHAFGRWFDAALCRTARLAGATGRPCVLAIVASSSTLVAGSADGPSEGQLVARSDAHAPASPDSSPAAETASFALPPGFRIELVACEPLVESPVQAVFDEDGRLWVVEMRGLARDVAGKGEPAGRISVLVDDDGDGRMDRASAFLDHLAWPRAVAPTRGGALVIAPPNLLYGKDTDGDGRADQQLIVDSGLAGTKNPEYGPNGLMPTLDNAFQCAGSAIRYRFVLGQWTKQRTAGGGQWGITKDDLGHVYVSTARDLLRADFVPSVYLARNQSIDAGPLVNAACAADQATHPTRLVPRVDGGSGKGLSNEPKAERSTLARGPLVYRGGAFPEEYRGNAFVCEPAGSLVKRLRFEERPPFARAARNVWQDREFLTSTDERFRPVSLSDGPDGALYVVDMYGSNFEPEQTATKIAAESAVARGLDAASNRGRIWRVVHEFMPKPRATNLSQMQGLELVGLLSNENGWTRDTAQRLLIEGTFDESKFLPALRELATALKSRLGRIHALWTLEGLRRIDAATCQKALESLDVDVRITGLRVAEPLLPRDIGPPIQFLLGCTAQPDPRLQQQAFATLSGAIDIGILAGLILRDASSLENRRAALSGIGSSQLLFSNAVLLSLNTPDHFTWDESAGRGELVRSIAAAIVREARSTDVGTLLTQFVPRATPKPWTRIALIDGALEGRGVGPLGQPGCIHLASRPDALLALLEGSDVELASKVAELVDALNWPGRVDVPLEPSIRPLGPIEAAAFTEGRASYASACVGCHQENGRGDPGLAPPLLGSEFVLGDPTIPARIVLGGLTGALSVGGRTWDSSMPPWKASDAEIAALLTYIRREWGHGADPVTVLDVASARAAAHEHPGPFAPDEVRKPLDRKPSGGVR